MTRDELCKKVLDSNLENSVKVELMKMLLNDNVSPTMIVYHQYETPRQFPEVWNDEGWWQQHLKDAQGDVASITNPIVTW